MSALVSAIALAARVHADELDKQGQPYIGHPLRVMAALAPDEDAMIVGVLHDVLETGRVRLDDLMEAIAGLSLIGAIGLMTHDPHLESYDDYIAHLRLSPLATRVKLADLADNLDERRGPLPASQRKRYLRARAVLTS